MHHEKGSAFIVIHLRHIVLNSPAVANGHIRHSRKFLEPAVMTGRPQINVGKEHIHKFVFGERNGIFPPIFKLNPDRVKFPAQFLIPKLNRSDFGIVFPFLILQI